MPIRVLGVDPSTAATGLALPDGRFRTISPRAGADDVAGRIHEIYCNFAAICRALRVRNAIDVAVIEGVMPSGNQAIARLRLGQLSGVLLLALYESAIPYVEVPLMSLKKYATTNGSAQKHDMVKAAKNDGARVADDNQADAHFLKKIGEDFYNISAADAQVMLTSYQLELHGRLNWPRL